MTAPTRASQFAKLIMEARCPEDVFGVEPFPECVPANYRVLMFAVHPDQNCNSLESQELSRALNDLKAEADARIKAGTYGDKKQLERFAPIALGAYQVHRRPVVGAVAYHQSVTDAFKGAL